jgi:hypothetical protein
MPMVAIIPVKKFKQIDKARQRFFNNMSKISDSFAVKTRTSSTIFWLKQRLQPNNSNVVKDELF